MQNQETQKNPSGKSSDDAVEKSQANTGSEVREGQENSSILHDENDGNKELPRDVTRQDISSTSQEEFLEDKNTSKKQGEQTDH